MRIGFAKILKSMLPKLMNNSNGLLTKWVILRTLKTTLLI